MRRRNPNSRVYRTSGLDSESRGYTRTQPTLLKVLKALKRKDTYKSKFNSNPNPNPKASPMLVREIKPYEKVWEYGLSRLSRFEIDVKYVPKECLSPESIVKYQRTELPNCINITVVYAAIYTAIDKYSRYRILCGYREHNTYTSSLFLCQVVSRV